MTAPSTARRTASGAATDTREKILRESSALFARRSYAGTSTREISRAVGISQPSLFHHFSSKQAIVEALLELDLLPATQFARRLAATAGPAAPRLYAYIGRDTEVLVSSPYHLGGLYTDDVMRAPEFGIFRRRRRELHDAIADMIGQGVESAEFIEVDPRFVQRIVTSLNMLSIDAANARSKAASDLPRQASDFVLRALLADPERLGATRTAAVALLADRDT